MFTSSLEIVKQKTIENYLTNIENGLKYLASVCDGSIAKDGCGFNAIDSGYGCSLAEQLNKNKKLSYLQYSKATKLLVKYKNQLISQNIKPVNLNDFLNLQQDISDYIENKSKQIIKKAKPATDTTAIDTTAIDTTAIDTTATDTTATDTTATDTTATPTDTTVTPTDTTVTPESFNPKNVITVQKDFIIIKFDFSYRILDAIKQIPNCFYERHAETNEKYWVTKASPIAIEKALNVLADFNFTIDYSVHEYSKKQYIDANNTQSLINKQLTLWIKKYDNHFPIGNKTLKFYEHQKTGIKALINAPYHGIILADDMGLGKTYTSLAAAKFLYSKYNYDNKDTGKKLVVFVISPKSVKSSWVKSASILELPIEITTWAKIPKPLMNSEYIIIADEAHNAQNYSSNRTQNFLNLALHVNCIRCFPCTGTPIKNGRPSNIFPLLRAIKHPIARNKREYELRYCDAHATAFTKWDISGSAHLEELQEIIKDSLIRRLKSDCLDLPDKSKLDIKCEDGDDKQYNDELIKLSIDYQNRLNKGEIKPGSDAMVKLSWFRRLASLYKVPNTIELANEILSQNRQVVIFTEFVETAEKLAQNFGVVPLTGKVKESDREIMIDNFQSGKTQVFVGTIKAGGVGITLTASSDNIIVDLPWTPGDLEQAEDRIYRIGQKNNCFIYNMFSHDIDYIMCAILGKKNENIDKVIKKYKLTDAIENNNLDYIFDSIMSKVNIKTK